MKTLLKLTRFPYEEPYHIELHVEASNGRQHAAIEFYTNANDLDELGDALMHFPDSETKEHIYEIGTADPAAEFAYHLLFRFFLIRPTWALTSLSGPRNSLSPLSTASSNLPPPKINS